MDKLIMNMTKNLRNLTSLCVMNAKIGANDVFPLITFLNFNPQLTHLDFSGNQIGDNGAGHLADMLRQNNTLTTLDLSNNAISNKLTSKLFDIAKRKHINIIYKKPINF